MTSILARSFRSQVRGAQRSFSTVGPRCEVGKVSQQGTGQVSSATSDHVDKDAPVGTGDNTQTTGKNMNEAIHNKPNNVRSHAKDPDESVFPQPVQDYIPESVERAIPNALHDTGKKQK